MRYKIFCSRLCPIIIFFSCLLTTALKASAQYTSNQFFNDAKRQQILQKYHNSLFYFWQKQGDSSQSLFPLLHCVSDSNDKIPPYFDINSGNVFSSYTYGARPDFNTRIETIQKSFNEFIQEMYPVLPDSNNPNNIEQYIPQFLLNQH